MSIALRILLAALAGLALGWLTWLAANHFIHRYRARNAMAAPVAAGRLSDSRVGAVAVLAAMALWGGWTGWQASSPAVAASGLVVTALLLCVILVDFQVRRIPDALVLALLAWAVVQLLWLERPGLGAGALGLAVAGGVFFVLFLIGRGALGMGDVKLEAALGALLGYPAVLLAMLAGMIAGGLAALVLLVTRRAGRKDPMAYGPYLALGAWLVLTRALGLWP